MTWEDKEVVSMKTIEERAKECTRRRADVLVGTSLASIFEKGYIAGATDQKIIDESIKIKKCDSMTRAEADRETAFLKWWYDNDGGTIAPSDAIEWARKDLLDKVCNWLGNYFVFEHEAMSAAGCDAFLHVLRKAMEK